MSIFKTLRILPVQLILCVLVAGFSASFLPLFTVNVIYTLSCGIKDILMIALPFVIWAYIWAAILSFGNKGLYLILATFGLIVIANMVALFTAYGISVSILPSIIDSSIPNFGADTTNSVKNLWSLAESLPFPILQPKYGMMLGLICGFVSVFLGSTIVNKIFPDNTFLKTLTNSAFQMRHYATQCLRKGFIPFLPLYISGFVFKIAVDGDLLTLMQGYAHTFLLICIVIFSYLLFWYFVGSNFNVQKCIESLKNMIPAGITGASTMSSSATMPLTLEGTEKNLKDRSFADFFIPSTVNSHLTGDGLSITITAIALLLMSGNQIPSLSTFIIFALHYCIVKFSAAGVPGGGVIVILPVVKDYLGLDDTLTPILQTIYMLQDPLLTSANVMGNGAFAMICHKIMKPFVKTKSTTVYQ